MRLTLSLLSLLTLLSPHVAGAQGQRYIFEQIKQLAITPDVYAMETDEYGRLWYSTWGRGVFCYDGYNHKRYITDSDNPNSITNDRVFDLVVDKRQRVWIGTLNGLNCLDRKTGLIRRFPNVFDSTYQFQALYEDRNGTIWVGTNDVLLRFDEKEQVLKPVIKNGKNTSGRCHAFFEDNNGTLWCCRSDGLFRFSADRSQCDKVILTAGEDQAPVISSMLEDSNGQFLVGSPQGLFYFDPALGQTTRVPLPDSMAYRRIMAMHRSPDGLLWISLRTFGLLRWDAQNNDFKLFKNNPFDPASLSSNYILSITTDKFGNLWLGSNLEVLRHSLVTQPFTVWPINAEDPNSRQNLTVRIAEDALGGLLVRSVEALFYIPKLGDKPIPLLIDGKNIPPADFCTGQDSTVWIIAGNLYRWDPATRSCILFPMPLKPEGIYNMEIDWEDPNVFWFATTKGLQRFDRRTGVVTPYLELFPAKHGQFVYNLVDDKRGNLWLHSPVFLGKFEKKSSKISLYTSDSLTPYRMVSKEILDMQVASDGWVWVTTSGGITRIDPSTGYFHNLTRNNGLLDNINPTVLFDKQNNAWIVHPEQVVRFDGQTGAMRTFEISNSFQTLLWTRGRCMLRDGRLLFASIKGLLLLDPAKIIENQAVSAILLTRFETTNKEKSAKLNLEFLQHIQLSYGENDLTIEWAGIQTAISKDLNYECKLERAGKAEPWEFKGKSLQSVYSNLAPGAYMFRVRIAGNAYPELTLSIAIAAPWYLSNWFKMLLAAMAVTLGYLLWLNRERQRQLRQQKELAEQNARYKTRFLANMSHEIRTPMNAILGLSRLLTESALPAKPSEYAEAIRQSSENLLVIVNDVLDQAKIESGKFQFQHKPFDLALIIRHLQNTLGFKAEEKSIQFDIKIVENTPTLLIGDPVRLSQILTNLLGNALKFTEKGFVQMTVQVLPPAANDETRAETSGEVAIKQQPQKPTHTNHEPAPALQPTPTMTNVMFSIRDSGIGIAAEKLEQVFESFQQADDGISAIYGGTGLGLSITKELVEQQRGSITLESIVGRGTVATVTMPFERATASANMETKVTADFSALQNLKILLVEDTFFNQMLAVELLKSRIPGVAIEVAENGQVALEKLEQNEAFDLVLMDVKMPVMDGMEATRRLRAMPQWKDLPVIALTANAVPEELEKCKAAGMDAWVTKPIDTESLFSTLYQVLKIKPV